jgi:hypothetical protein
MKILNRVGGTFLLLILAIAVTLGFQSPTGRPIWNDIWETATSVLKFVQDAILRLVGTPVSGDASVAIAAAGVGVIAVLALSKKPVSVRTFSIVVLLAAVAALVLYNPAIVA